MRRTTPLILTWLLLAVGTASAVYFDTFASIPWYIRTYALALTALAVIIVSRNNNSDYSSLLIHVDESNLLTTRQCIELDSLEAMADLAVAADQMMMWAVIDGIEIYQLTVHDTLYRYYRAHTAEIHLDGPAQSDIDVLAIDSKVAH